MCQQQICPQMPDICHICQLLHLQIWENYVSISTSYELNAMKCDHDHYMHTFHITGICSWTNKYACHTAHVCPTAILLSSTYRNQISAHSIKIQYIAIYINPTTENMSHEQLCPSNAIYMPHAQITWHPFKGVYANICATKEVTVIKTVVW